MPRVICLCRGNDRYRCVQTLTILFRVIPQLVRREIPRRTEHTCFPETIDGVIAAKPENPLDIG